jgi:hypothetical protein
MAPHFQSSTSAMSADPTEVVKKSGLRLYLHHDLRKMPIAIWDKRLANIILL